jgi:dsRNA-specific ribonuclease
MSHTQYSAQPTPPTPPTHQLRTNLRPTAEERTAITRDDDINLENGTLTFDPYNPINREITLSDVQSILQKYGIDAVPQNLEIYRRAFIHSSYTRRPVMENEALGIEIVDQPTDCMRLKTKSNERLEFIGDGVLECVTKYYLYRRFPKADEGFMTEKKIAIVKNEHIGKLAYEMGLAPWFVISKHAEEKGIRTNVKKMGCLFEAFIGALFLDFNKIQIHDSDRWFDELFSMGPGFQMAQIFIERVLEKHINWVRLVNENDNYKNVLQVLVQKEFKVTPDYIQHSHDADGSGYEVGVYLCIGKSIHHIDRKDAIPLDRLGGGFAGIRGEMARSGGNVLVRLGVGVHRTKKKAEQDACMAIIESIKKIT